MVLATTALLSRAGIGLGALPLVAILRAGVQLAAITLLLKGSSPSRGRPYSLSSSCFRRRRSPRPGERHPYLSGRVQASREPSAGPCFPSLSSWEPSWSIWRPNEVVAGANHHWRMHDRIDNGAAPLSDECAGAARRSGRLARARCPATRIHPIRTAHGRALSADPEPRPNQFNRTCHVARRLRWRPLRRRTRVGSSPVPTGGARRPGPGRNRDGIGRHLHRCRVGTAADR